MEKDYIPSTKYTKIQIKSLDIPSYYQDSCVNEYADFIICVRKNPVFSENPIIQALPLSSLYSSCKVYKEVWDKCQTFREEEIFEEMRKLYMRSETDYEKKKNNN